MESACHNTGPSLGEMTYYGRPLIALRTGRGRIQGRRRVKITRLRISADPFLNINTP